MSQLRPGIFAILLVGLMVGACQSDRFGPPPFSSSAPLTPPPWDSEADTRFPPPAGSAGANVFPDAPEQSDSNMAALEPSGLPAERPEIAISSISGVWNVSLSGQNCRVATPQTKYGQGFRAGPLRCPAPFDRVKSWSVKESQLSFYDENGDMLAQLYSSGQERFSGQTTTGMPISISR